uniref:Uncharacterized protein n=1 Tax=Acrobeloides nanus TaxID=290746 RepID=A0A914DW35_9BILA
MYADGDINGHVLQTISASTLSDCAVSANAQTTLKGFAYNSATSSCTIYDALYGLQPESGLEDYIPVSLYNGSGCPSTVAFYTEFINL